LQSDYSQINIETRSNCNRIIIEEDAGVKRRGFVQFAILHLLEEGPMHGYQIMKELEERSSGAYVASAGTIYPALQELLDRQLIEVQAEGDKKVYTLNENGRRRLEEAAREGKGDFWQDWKEVMIWKRSDEARQLEAAIEEWKRELHRAIKDARGNPERVHALIAIIEEATERLRNHTR